MKRLLSSTQIIGPCRMEGQDFEACATANAQYDEEQSQLLIALDSFLRPTDLRFQTEHLRTDYLPKKQNLKESVSEDEAPELARDIFRRWVGTVRQSITSSVHN